ncbi:MAG TPA: wax ester/triacylglycerol synthase family O-acyltransferase [Solirubrobacterales bacterium]|nr:wax ester/triacylglycerol synthase family O-acyltransferase [Solirubrobacterales bacterium]
MASGDRLTGLDSSFLHLEDGPAHMHVASTTVFEGPTPDFDDLCRHIDSRMHLVPRFRQKLKFVRFGQGRPVWIDDPQFNLHYHLRHTALPEPGSEQQLRTLAARIFSQRLDRSKPLWEMWLVDGLEGGRFAIVTKSHHCLVDGVSGVDITTVLFDAAPDAPTPSAPEPWVAGPEPSDAQMLSRALVERAVTPAEAVRGARALFRRPRKIARSIVDALESVGALARAGIAAPDSPFNVPISPYRRFEWVHSDLAELKSIKNTVGGTVNDVVLAAVAGALGRYLRARGHATAGLELKAMVPISVRLSEQHGDLGNKVSAMYAALPVGIEDPAERLRAISAGMGDLKESKQAVGATLLTDLADFAPPTIIGQAGRLQSRQRFFNMVVTNVPGPQFPLYLMGRELQALYPMVPLAKRQAVCFGIMSYNGQVNFGLIGDYEAMADLDSLAHDLSESLADLAGLVSAGSDPSPETLADPAERRRGSDPTGAAKPA